MLFQTSMTITDRNIAPSCFILSELSESRHQSPHLRPQKLRSLKAHSILNPSRPKWRLAFPRLGFVMPLRCPRILLNSALTELREKKKKSAQITCTMSPYDISRAKAGPKRRKTLRCHDVARCASASIGSGKRGKI